MPGFVQELRSFCVALAQSGFVLRRLAGRANLLNMSMCQAYAHANVALIKYWGKRNEVLKIPAAGSISLTLDALTTSSAITFSPDLQADAMELDGKSIALPLGAQTILTLIRTRTGVADSASIQSANNFPTAAGLASSASGMAALALGASKAAGLELNATELSLLARRGSASAARSIFAGFVEMFSDKSATDQTAYAKQLAPAEHWALEVVVALTSRGPKAISSSEGMRLSAAHSAYYQAWIDDQDEALRVAREAILGKDFQKLADVAQFNTLKMHGLMLATPPGLVYWNATTLACIQAIMDMQKQGVAVFFSIDAGPQVKAICLPEASPQVQRCLESIEGVEQVIHSGLGRGAWLA